MFESLVPVPSDAGPPDPPDAAEWERQAAADPLGEVWGLVADALLEHAAAEAAGRGPDELVAAAVRGLSAGELAGLDAGRALTALADCERLIASLQALQLRVLDRFARLRPDPDQPNPDQPDPGGFSEFAADEVGCELGLSRNTAGARLHLAVQLTRRLPGTLAALERGLIDLPKARMLADLTDPLSRQDAAGVERRVLPGADGATLGQLRAATRRAVLRVDPAGAEARHQQRTAERRVEIRPAEDGLADLYALQLRADHAVAIYRRIDDLARHARTPGDDRTADQRRTDTFTDLLLGRLPTPPGPADTPPDRPPPSAAGNPGRGAKGGCRRPPHRHHRPRAEVQVTLAATTALGLDQLPGDLAGYGPIPAGLARELAADGEWRRLLTDPATGILHDHGRRTYRPTAGLDAHVRARHRRCSFPGCRHPAHRCDLDHSRAYPDGPTCHCNLTPLCRHHHRLKTEDTGWTLTHHTPGVLTWTSPTGRRYTTRPEPLTEPRPPRAYDNDHPPPGEPPQNPAAPDRPPPDEPDEPPF